MNQKPRRFTIERLRTAVLIGGGLLVAAIGIFLGLGQWRLYRQLKDLPKRLGIDIQQQADGVDYTQSRKGKTLFKIHAARAVEMKTSGKMLLHDVRIDLYGEDGSRTDTITGSDFEYDHTAGIAHAAGPVQIIVMRPGVKPAITQLSQSAPKSGPQTVSGATPDQHAADRQIYIKTSGLTFDQKSGTATTGQRVDFHLQQGDGSSTGATYDSAKGHLVLDRDVELHVERNGEPVAIHAGHADFERVEQLCTMTTARAEYTGGTILTANALMHFREDGSIARLDGSGGVDLQTNTGSRATAPRGNVDFDQQNHPQHALLEGGATLEQNQPTRQTTGSAPTVKLQFDAEGELRQAHLEQGVHFNSRQQGVNARGNPVETDRDWKSLVADVTFVDVTGNKASPTSTQVEPKTIHGSGGVVVISDTDAASAKDHAILSADTVVAGLAPGGAMQSLSGTGHAHFDQKTAQGVHQASSSDQLDVAFVPDSISQPNPKPAQSGRSMADSSQIASITQIGHVVLEQQSPQKPSPNPTPAQHSNSAGQAIRATADRSDYDGPTQMLHLTGSPRVHDGELDMTAVTIDFARATGDAFAHGNVKASWLNTPASAQGAVLPGATLLSTGGGATANSGPIHAIADQAEIHQATEEVVFHAAPLGSATHGSGAGASIEPRLWQASNSISAPTITLNRQKQTLTAQADGAANPVRTVLLSNSSTALSKAPQTRPNGHPFTNDRQTGPSIIRLRSGDLHYSEGQRIALLHAGSVGNVTAETTRPDGNSTVVSQQAEIQLLPSGIHTPAKQSGSNSSNSSIDQLTALGNVTVNWPDRKGTGEKLVYLADQGTFTLTGTSSLPPRITDPVRGTVTGNALVFHTADDSVTVEGGGTKTITETESPKKHPRP